MACGEKWSGKEKEKYEDTEEGRAGMRIRTRLAVVGILGVVSLCACGGSIQSNFGWKENRYWRCVSGQMR